MVKKTDTYARVLRPGESMSLGKKSAEFEIVLFRPQHHQRSEGSEDSGQGGGAASASVAERDCSPRDAPSSNVGNRVKFALEPDPSSGSRADKKKSDMAFALGHVPNSSIRESSGDAVVEEMVSSPTRRRWSNGGNEIRLSDEVADAPLFFDTTVCIFYDEVTKMDYVATGRTTADSKGLHYIPHLVVLGDEAVSNAYCNYNITRSDGDSLAEEDEEAGYGEADEEDSGAQVSRSAANNGPVTMAAGDGVTLNLRRLGTCAGFLVCGTMFAREAWLNREHNVFYMVRKPKSPVPLCLVPLCASAEPSKSCISVMVRKIKVHGDTVWELVNVNEGSPLQDVKSLVLRMQERRLKDPAHFTRDFEVKLSPNQLPDVASGVADEEVLSGSAESSSSELDTSDHQRRFSEAHDQERRSASTRTLHVSGSTSAAGPSRNGRTFSGLLADVPRVTREGRRQYSVGRSHVQINLFDGDTSDEDEVLDDAMRAVVPSYANTSLVRYENGAYNVGSKVDNLVTHYVGHREMYGLDAAGQRSCGGLKTEFSRDGVLPHLNSHRRRVSSDWSARMPVLDRCQEEGEGGVTARPALPADLLCTSHDKRLAAAQEFHRSSVASAAKKRHSTAVRMGRSLSIRPPNSRKKPTRLAAPPTDRQRGAPSRKKGGVKGAHTSSAATIAE